jgi:Tfp pilus assembly protein FimV
MPDSPLKIEVLRKAFIDLNPLAFPAGNASRMLKGVVLQIPDAPKLLASIAAPASQELVMNKKISGPMSGDYEERRRWVRYP